MNIPTTTGLVYRAAVATRQTGAGMKAFERLWQVGLPSPHLWYFDGASLTRMCEGEAFRRIESFRLDSLRRKGLWERAHFTQSPTPVSVLGVLAGYLASPVLNSRWGSDIMCLMFRRPSAP